MSIATELLLNVSDYLSHRISLEELEYWLAPRLPLLLDAPDSVAGRIAGAIELYFAEFHDDLRTERSLRMSLRRYIAVQQNTWVSADPGIKAEVTTSANAFATGPSLSLLQSWSNEPAEVIA